MAGWCLTSNALRALLGAPGFDRRYAPMLKGMGPDFGRIWPDGNALDLSALSLPRGPSSVKSFCFPPTEALARYPEQGVPADSAEEPDTLVVGIRACELGAVEYLDRVFGSPPQEDPFYLSHRRRQTFVSIDCVQPHSTCFCNLAGGRPYATEGFDVNLTPLDGVFIAEAGSEKGNALLDQTGTGRREADEDQLARRDEQRRQAVERLEQANAIHAPRRSPTEALAAAEDASIWDRLGQGCVECGACTQICPTCHCFYLFDQRIGEGSFERGRAWDSCVFSGYSRMAGGPDVKPNPRSRFRSRFANRFLHKYLWSPRQWEMTGCVGCGRCIEACPGQIDLRDVIREVSA